MRIEITPTDALADGPLSIRLREFPPNREITIRATTVDRLRCKWEAWVSFGSGPSGDEIDLSVQKPLKGTYEQADAGGLIWSMLPDKGIKEPSPFNVSASEALVVQFVAEVGGNVVARTDLRRSFLVPEIIRTPVRENGLVATLFHHRNLACPAVIYLTGSGGGLVEGDAALLASRGFTVLSLAYFGIETLPRQLCEIPLEYFQKAVEWLVAHAAVSSGRIAVMGRSKGGELALLLGGGVSRNQSRRGLCPKWRGLDEDWRSLVHAEIVMVASR